MSTEQNPAPRNGAPLPRDVSRFRHLSPGDRAVIPPGAPLRFAALTTRDLIDQAIRGTTR